MIHCAGMEVCRSTDALKLSSLRAVREEGLGWQEGAMERVRRKLRSFDLQALARVGNQHLCCHVEACLAESGGRPVER